MFLHNPKDAPNITVKYIVEDGEILIQAVFVNDNWAGEWLKECLMEQHGDRWCDEIEKSLRKLGEQCRVDSIRYDEVA